MKLRLICCFLVLVCVSGCVASKKTIAKAPTEMVSLPDVRERIIAYHDSGKYREDISHKAEAIADVAVKAIQGQVKYPAVVMVVEDVLLSTYEARRKQGFSDNAAAVSDLESHIILSTLPAVRPSIVLFEFLLQRNIPVFLVSYRAEGFRVPLMENLSKAGFSGWQKLFMLPPNYPEGSNYCEEVRKGLQGAGYNVIATIGVLPEDIAGDFKGHAALYPNYIYSER
ncbi:HAD family acid phosphatase [Maridesulfovibrio sp.]|uniref:HAD family acid phosphatase n=1 Tax=Maridesulfovibrio sp. TaxID=2795000 RepID=UPI002A18716B|nr:HAD family acid phosphatase [Maridesulfovibrio sp.]